ncbi:uncharacterized protein LOC130928742 isoform X2 [Corythoichthys intestinalis]|uniref:uncharacterized protein LOC130928742 isoform X2 n=1 Tax=Corythoichthys intestinalis TaxID=161448 RepID=UPI0025A5BE26|nr:uncharacterized protein LOC130928742 isoform X2 [Corythoichthys intestinalis]
MSHNHYGSFSSLRRQTDNDPRRSFSGERLGFSSSAGLSQAYDCDAINTSQEIHASKQNDREQDFLSLGTTARSSQNINRHSDVGDSPVSRLPDPGQTSAAATSSKYYQPSKSGGRSLLPASSEEDRNPCSSPCLPYSEPDMDRSSESPHSNFTAESAADILLKFGLEHEDLEYLFSYPEDQITPETLPFILRQIRIKKTKKVSDASCSKPLRAPAPDRDDASGDNWRGLGLAQKDTPAPLRQSSKVINYRHMDKYTGRMEEDVQGVEADNLLTINEMDKSCSQDLVQQAGRNTNSSLDQQTRPSSFFSFKSHDPVKPAPAVVQSIFPSFSTEKETDLRKVQPHALKSGDFEQVQPVLKSILKPQPQALKSSDFEQVQPLLKPILKPQPQAPKPVLRHVHPSKPDLVVLGGDDTSSSCDPFKNIAPASDNKSKKQQKPSQWKNIEEEQSQKEVNTQKPPEVKKTQHPPSEKQPSLPIPAKLQNPAIKQHLLANLQFVPMERQEFHPVPKTFHIPSLLTVRSDPLCTLGQRSGVAHDLIPAQETVFPGLPTAVLVRDYAATTPKIFPHLCSLCNKECVHLKDWLTHQNTNSHLENCKVLRQQYPEWNGDVKSCKDKASNEAPPPEVQSKKPRHRSRSSSRSITPRRHRSRSSETRREKRPRRRTRSRSPQSSRYQRRSRFHSSRSRSRSPSPRSRSPSHSSNSSKYHRSRSRSYEKHPSRRTQEGHSSSSRRYEKRSFTRRRSSSRSRHKKRSSPERSRERLSPAKRRREASATPETSQEFLTKADRLAKNLMKTSVVQSLSKQSDMEDMVKILAPALLAELAKMTSSKARPAETSKATSSSSAANKKPVVGKTTSNQQKVSSAKIELVKTSGPTIVTLKGGVLSSFTQKDIVTAVEVYGKIKSVILFRHKTKAIVCFERKQDADKMRKERNIKIKGFLVSVQQEKEGVSSVRKHKPHLNSLSPTKVSKTKTSKSSSVAPAAQIKAKTVPSKPINKTMKKVPDKAKLKPTCKDIRVALEPTSGSAETPATDLIPPLAPLQKGAPQHSSEKAASRDAALRTKVVPSQGPGARLAKDLVQSADVPLKGATMDLVENRDVNVTLKDDASARLETDAVPLESSNIPLNGVAPLLNCDEAATMDLVENRDVNVVLKDDAKTRLDKDAVPPESPDVHLKGVVAASPDCDAALTMDLVENREANVASKEDARPGLAKDVVPPQDFDVPLKVVSASLPNSDESATMDLVENRYANVALKDDAIARLETEAVPPESSDVPLKGVASLVNRDEAATMDLVENRDGNVALKDDARARLEMDAVPPESSDVPLKGVAAASPDCDAALTMTLVENRDANVALKEDARPGLAKDVVPPQNFDVPQKVVLESLPHNDESATLDLVENRDASVVSKEDARAGLAKNAVPPESSDVPLRGVAAHLPDSDVAVTTDPVENNCADETMKDDATSAWGNAYPSPHNPDVTLTAGERMCDFLLPHRIAAVVSPYPNNYPEKFSKKWRQLLIYNLPVDQHSYCVQDIIKLFLQFGFDPWTDNIYVLPQSRMAFVELKHHHCVLSAMHAGETNRITLKGQKLELRVLRENVPMFPKGFYKWVMKFANFPAEVDYSRVIFFPGITPSETAILRKALRKMVGVKNFLPLHNKRQKSLVTTDQPSTHLDSQLNENEEDTVFSEHKDNDEEAEAYQKIDSMEDQPASTDNGERVSEASESQERKESPKKQERTTAKTPEPEKDLVVDSLQANDSSSTPMSGKRRSTQGKTQKHTAKIFVQDSVEEDAFITVRATRKRGRPPKKGTASEKEKTVSRTSPETAKKEAPIEKMVVVIEEPTNEVLNHIKVPAPKRKGGKGRPKKDVKKMKKDTADHEEAAATFEVMDSLEDETSTGKTQSSLKMEDATNRMSHVKLKVDVEATNQVEDQIQEEMSTTEVSESGKTAEPQTELEDKATRSENKLEVDIEETYQTETQKQQHSPQPLPPHPKKDHTPHVTSALTLDQVGHVEEDILTCGIEKQSRTDHEGISTSEDQSNTEAKSWHDVPQPLENASSDGQHTQEMEREEKDASSELHMEEINTSSVTLDHIGLIEKDILTSCIETHNQLDHEGISTSKDQEQPEEAAPLENEEEVSLPKLGNDKRMVELASPSVKRLRSESPFRPTAFVLPPFNPDNPLGTEFVNPKSVYFCHLCSDVYLKERMAKEVHCKSRKHYNNLKKHYSKCEKDSRASTQGAAVPD